MLTIKCINVCILLQTCFARSATWLVSTSAIERLHMRIRMRRCHGNKSGDSSGESSCFAPAPAPTLLMSVASVWPPERKKSVMSPCFWPSHYLNRRQWRLVIKIQSLACGSHVLLNVHKCMYINVIPVFPTRCCSCILLFCADYKRHIWSILQLVVSVFIFLKQRHNNKRPKTWSAALILTRSPDKNHITPIL